MADAHAYGGLSVGLRTGPGLTVEIGVGVVGRVRSAQVGTEVREGRTDRFEEAGRRTLHRGANFNIASRGSNGLGEPLRSIAQRSKSGLDVVLIGSRLSDRALVSVAELPAQRTYVFGHPVPGVAL